MLFRSERSFAALRMTLLHRLRLIRNTSYLKCIGVKGSHAEYGGRAWHHFLSYCNRKSMVVSIFLHRRCSIRHKHARRLYSHPRCTILKAGGQAFRFHPQLLIDVTLKSVCKTCHGNITEVSMRNMDLKKTGTDIWLYHKRERPCHSDTQYTECVIPFHHHLITLR